MASIPHVISKYLRPRNYLLFILWRWKLAQIYIHSKKLTSELRKVNQRALFLDCGSNLGQGFEFFKGFYKQDRFDFILFEPNPHCFKILEQKYSGLRKDGVRLMNVAVGSEEGEVEFYGLDETQGGIYSVGGSILPEHNSRMYTTARNSNLKVHSINFNNFLNDLFDKEIYSTYILKLDIEGGEYQILDSLIENRKVNLFESIYVEFHSQYMNQEFMHFYQNKEKLFFRQAKKMKTRVVNWI